MPGETVDRSTHEGTARMVSGGIAIEYFGFPPSIGALWFQRAIIRSLQLPAVRVFALQCSTVRRVVPELRDRLREQITQHLRR